MNRIDAVIKIGGSVIRNVDMLRDLCDNICMLVKYEYKIIVIPGGGDLVNKIRKMYKKYDLSDNIIHWMAIKAMDINGMLLSNLNKNFITATTVKDCIKQLDYNKTSVFLPFNFLRSKDELPKSWDVTSDSISLYLTEIINAKYSILLKDVDGIYKNNNPNNVMNYINANELSTLNQNTCVDKYLPDLISKYRRKVHIVSGFHPDRIKQILTDSSDNVGTVITP